MKSSTYKATFAIAAVAITAVGILHNPDTANAEVAGVPGYQSIANVPNYEPLSADSLAKLNAPSTETIPTF